MGYAIWGDRSGLAKYGRRVAAFNRPRLRPFRSGTAIQIMDPRQGWINMLQCLYHDRRYFGVDPGTIEAAGRGTGMRSVRHPSPGPWRRCATSFPPRPPCSPECISTSGSLT